MGIKMNYTNFTTDKPAVYEQSSVSTFGSGRDIAYLVFSILQFGITVFGLVLVNYIIRKKDKKDERERLEKDRKDERERSENDRKDERERSEKDRRHKEAKEEHLEKAERDKIADIISNGYNTIVEDGIDENLRKCKAKFEAMVMFYGDAALKITGLDVLRFMLRNQNDHEDQRPLKKLQKDLDAVVRLFRTLRIKLPLKGDCPNNIKEDLGPFITDVGEIARSFVSAKNRYTIAKVLKYFGNVLEEVGSIEDKEKEDVDHNKEIGEILPYVNGLSLGETWLDSLYELIHSPTTYHDQDFSFYFGNWNLEQEKTIAALKDIQCALCKKEKTIRAEDLRSFANKIDAIWRRKFQQTIDISMPDWSEDEHLRTNILHAVRVFMFKVVEGSDIMEDEEFKELLVEMKNTICNVQGSEKRQKGRSEKAIQGIIWLMRDLTRDNSHLCNHQSIADVLEEMNEKIINSIRQAWNNP